MPEISQQQLDDYVAGKTELKDLIGLDADHLEQLKGRAQFFLDGEHHERALIMLEMLEELDRSDTLPTLLAIDLLLGQGNSDAAEEKIETLLARDPDDADALVAKAQLLVQTGQMVPAAELLERVIAEDPDATSDAGKRAQALAARAHDLLKQS